MNVSNPHSAAVRALIEVGLDELQFVLPLDMAPIVCPAKRSEFELDADAAEEEQMGGNGADASTKMQDDGTSADEWIALYVMLNMLPVAVQRMTHWLLILHIRKPSTTAGRGPRGVAATSGFQPAAFDKRI